MTNISLEGFFYGETEMNKEKLKQEIDKKGIFFEEYEYDLLYDIIKKTDKQELEEFKLEIKQAKQQAEIKELREHYAGLAMQGLLANMDYSTYSPGRTAKISVECANALIEQLNKDKEDG